MNRKKEQSLTLLKAILEQSSILAVYQQNGLQSHEMIALQQYLQRHQLQMKVTKNTALRHLVKSTRLSYFGNLFEGPCFVVYTTKADTVAPFTLHQVFPKLTPLGAYACQGYVNGSDFTRLSQKASLFEDYAQVAQILSSPAFQLVSSLDVVSGELSLSLDASSSRSAS